MIFFGFSLSNPWAKDGYRSVYSYYKPLSVNKSLEIEVSRYNTLIAFSFNLTYRSNHSGLSVRMSLLNYNVEIFIADNRHWDSASECWYNSQ